MTDYYFWFGIFTFIFYLVATDDSVSYAVVLVSKIVRVRYERTKWWVLHNPANPIVKYMMWRRAWKMAEEFKKEFGKDTE
jgi:hypothetical protein